MLIIGPFFIMLKKALGKKERNRQKEKEKKLIFKSKDVVYQIKLMID